MDLSRLEQLDVVCFDQCWARDQWEEIVKNHVAKLVFTSFGLAGFWCARVIEPEVPDGVYDIQIIKIGVLPKHRRQGLSRAILRDVRLWLQQDFVGPSEYKLSTIIPDCLLQPDWTSFIGGWLAATGFKPCKDEMLLSYPHAVYGRNFQHAVRFDFPILPGVYGL
jgi:GNAT superfamily N-acetyltransferase